MIVLNAADVRELLPMGSCIDLMRDAFRRVSSGQADQPIRRALRTRDGSGLLSLMPGYLDEPRLLGIKLITVFPGNTAASSHQGMVLLFDAADGSPQAIVDASEITAVRTAAATAAATDALARPEARVLSIIGTGEQARSHLEALTQVRAFEEILIWGRDRERAEALADWAFDRLSLQVEVAAGARDAVERGDVICTVTAAPEPIVAGAWLRPGSHLNSVGSSIPSTSEIDGEVVERSRVFVDYRDSALELAGDLRRAIEAGRIGLAHIAGEVGDVLNGTVVGRRGPDDITLFKSLGMAAEDLLSAAWVVERATAAGRGQQIAWRVDHR